MTIWLTSDLHFGHRKVADLRGFGNETDEHDGAIADNWTSVVRKDDQVWILGDIAVSNPAAALELIDSLPGIKHLIAGNHDPVHPMHRDAFKWQGEYHAVFDSVQPFARRKYDGRDVLLSHFPYSADRGEMRYPQWRLPDLGAWLLHGHTHSIERFTSPREIHVGVDAWNLTPVSLDELGKHIRDAA